MVSKWPLKLANTSSGILNQLIANLFKCYCIWKYFSIVFFRTRWVELNLIFLKPWHCFTQIITTTHNQLHLSDIHPWPLVNQNIIVSTFIFHIHASQANSCLSASYMCSNAYFYVTSSFFYMRCCTIHASLYKQITQSSTSRTSYTNWCEKPY